MVTTLGHVIVLSIYSQLVWMTLGLSESAQNHSEIPGKM